MAIMVAQNANYVKLTYMEDEAEREYTDGEYLALFMGARIENAFKLDFACRVIERMPRKSGPHYRKFMRAIDEGIDLIKDTMEEIHA